MEFLSQLENDLYDIDWYIQAGECYISTGEYESAKLCFDKAVDIDPDHPAAYTGSALIFLAEGDYENAIAGFRFAIRLHPSNSRAHAGLASIYQEMEQYSEASEHYLKSLEQDPNNLAALLGLFQVSSQMGSFSRVIYYLEYYLQANPEDSAVSFCLANLYLKEMKLEKAREVLKKQLVHDPLNQDAVELLEEVENMLAQRTLKVA